LHQCKLVGKFFYQPELVICCLYAS